MEPEISTRCVQCGAAVRPQTLFCPECGRPAEPKDQRRAPSPEEPAEASEDDAPDAGPNREADDTDASPDEPASETVAAPLDQHLAKLKADAEVAPETTPEPATKPATAPVVIAVRKGPRDPKGKRVYDRFAN